MAGVTALQQSVGRAGGGSRKHWFLVSFALHRWRDSPPHRQDRRLPVEVARPSALLGSGSPDQGAFAADRCDDVEDRLRGGGVIFVYDQVLVAGAVDDAMHAVG
jgi:hypothetical protein